MAKKKINRGGVIPYRIDEGEIKMLFMVPAEKKFGGEEPQLAKGKQEEGEDDETTAFREAKEELGLFKPNCENIQKLGVFMGRTTVFIAEVKDMNMFGEPHFETKETVWLTPSEFNEQGRDLHKPVVKAAARLIEDSDSNLERLKK